LLIHSLNALLSPIRNISTDKGLGSRRSLPADTRYVVKHIQKRSRRFAGNGAAAFARRTFPWTFDVANSVVGLGDSQIGSAKTSDASNAVTAIFEHEVVEL
jgi:hypothetical protein